MSEHLFPSLSYQDIFYHSPVAKLVIGTDAPCYTILDVNNAYLLATNSTRESLTGKSVFAVFPQNPSDLNSKNIERTIDSFEQAIRTKQPHIMRNYRYDIPIPGTNEFEERYWTTSNTPILDEEGNVLYFIHSPENVTELYKLAEKERAAVYALKIQREQLYSTFMQAPVGIGIFKGPQFITDLINPQLCQLYDKTADEMMGKPIFDVLTEAKGQGFEELLDNVRLTGIPFKGEGLEVTLKRNGKNETVYVNFVYEPFREEDHIIGVIAVATEITDHINAKRQAQEAEERARLAVDAVGLGTFDLDLRTTEMITSLRFANIFGFQQPVPRAEYVKVFHPDDLEGRLKAHAEALISGRLFYEARVIWPDQSVHWLRVEGRVLYEQENPVRVLGTLLDFTRQKQDTQNQRKLLTLADNSVDLMSILELNGTNSYINQAGLDMLGFDDASQVNTTPITELHRPEDYKLVEEVVLPTVMNEGRWAGEMLVKHLKTGEVFPVFNNTIRIDDPVAGTPIAVGAVMRDMRPERAAKQALADSEHLLRSITTAAPTTLWMSDAYGAITYVNQAWTDWTNLSFQDSLGAGWLNAVFQEDQKNFTEKFMLNLVKRGFFEVEFRIIYADGSIHWCVATGKPQYFDNARFGGYIGACIDITEQKVLQKQKDNFIAIASHELKTPVTSIKAYAQVLEEILKQRGQVTEANMINKMDVQLNRLIRLISELLDVTKINSGKLQYNNTVFEFEGLVKELAEDLQRTTRKHRLVERPGTAAFVYGDKERLGQVITNLITNAIKYSPDGGDIIIETVVNNNEIICSVQDFGIGISPTHIAKIFEQFYQITDNTQHTYPGLGLGLYISAEIIKISGGRIWVISTPGKGSCFSFSLPLHVTRQTSNS